MARASAVVEGGEELVQRLRALGIDVNAALELATMAAAEVIERGAESRAPGPQIEALVVERQKSRVEVDVGPTREKWHWRFLETGVNAHEIAGKPLLAFNIGGENVVIGGASHPGMSAQPFLRPAFDTGKNGAVQEFGERIKKAVGER